MLRICFDYGHGGRDPGAVYKGRCESMDNLSIGTGVEVFVYTKASPKAIHLASEIQKALVSCGFRDRGVKKANFQVLRTTVMPAVLIELGFIDNSLDNELLDENRDEIIEKIAKAILVGIPSISN